MRFLISRSVGFFFTAALLACTATAQTFPTKPVHLVVPYPAGGATDFFARAVFGKVGDVLGQPVVIDNRPGAGTTIGAEYVAKSSPDGYTLLIGDMGTFSLNPSLYKRLRFDPKKDFAPVSLSGRVQLVLVVNSAAVPVKTVDEFLTYAKSNPGKINYAAPGPGSPLHVAMDLFKQQGHVELVGIPYKGTGDAVNDLLGGQVQAMFLDIATAQQHVKGGPIRAIGLGSAKPSAALPGVPTISDSGMPGFEAYAWNGLVAPAGTPAEVIAKLNTAFAKAMQDPEVKQRLADAVVEPLTGSPAQFTAFMESETAKWAKVIKTSNIVLD